tara:strand:+ start:74 stop:409 length:336 start_codon:yes stop_codon:yes gene_type:complete
MDNLGNIYDEINQILFYGLIDGESVITDEGEGNLQLENGQVYRYNVKGFNEYGKRSSLELKLLEYINRSITALNRVQSIIDINGPYMFDDSNDEDDRPTTIEETMESMTLS